MYKVKSRTGSQEVKPPWKISSIDGVVTDFYVSDVIPRPTAIPPTLMEADAITMNPLSISGGDIIEGAEFSFRAQVEFDKNIENNPDQGPQTPKTKGRLIALSAGRGNNRLLEIFFTDSLEGLMFPGLFSVQYTPAPTMTGGNAALMIEPTLTPGTPVDIDLQFIELTDQYAFGEGVKQKVGDAVIKFTRNQLTQDQIGANGAYFEITPLGGSPIHYQVWNASEGVKQEQTYHWCIYLKRVRS